MSEPAAEAPIVHVTLFEDRAHVARRGRVALPAGPHRLRIEGVSPALADKTLFATSPDAGVRVVHARVERVAHAERGEVPARIQGLEDALREARQALRRQIAERERTERRRRSAARAGELAVAEIGESVAYGAAEPAKWKEAIEATGAAERAAAERLVAIAESIRDAEREVADLEARRRAAASPSETVAAAIVLDVVAEESGQATFRVDYVVPGACWRPYHRARLAESPESAGELRLSFQCDGCVWQNTGEPWTDVELSFSTERLSLGARPPLLDTDLLGVRKRAPTIAVQQRDREVERPGLGAGAASTAVPGIDDGGVVLALPGRTRASIPSDGRPYRIPIFTFDATAEAGLVVVGERVEAVVERSRHVHTSAHPILAGPVDLVRDSGVVGRTQVLFVAPGERFELGWGPDPALRVHREVEELDVKESSLSGWYSRRHNVHLHLSNLGPTPRRVEVVERVPVSEIDKVEIEHHAADTTERKIPDGEGFIRWHVTLGPRARQTLRLSFTVKHHPDVVGM